MDAFSNGVNSWLIARALGSEDDVLPGHSRSTTPKMRTISPNSVPSMMTAPTSATPYLDCTGCRPSPDAIIAMAPDPDDETDVWDCDSSARLAVS